MKKIIVFALNCIFAESHGKPLAKFILIPSLLIGICTAVPELWLGHIDYSKTILSYISPYFFLPFGIFCVAFLFIAAPFMYYAGRKRTPSKLLLIMSTFLCMVPGALCFKPLLDLLKIPNGFWMFPIMFILGNIYARIICVMFKKPFTVYYPSSELAR